MACSSTSVIFLDVGPAAARRFKRVAHADGTGWLGRGRVGSTFPVAGLGNRSVEEIAIRRVVGVLVALVLLLLGTACSGGSGGSAPASDTTLDKVKAAGVLRISGDRELAGRFVTLFPLPPKAGA